VDGHVAPVLNLDDDVERRRRFALEHRLLRAAAPSFLIRERHALDAANQIRQRGIHHQVFERVAVRGGHQLDPALGNGAGRGGFELGPDLVDDDDLGHMVFDGLDHHGVLHRRRRDLHPPRAAHGGMGDIAIAADLIRGIDDHDAFAQIVGEDAGGLAQQRGLAHTGPPHHQNAATRLDDVSNDGDGPEDGAPDATGDADDAAFAVANGGDAMQGALDAGAVVVTEGTDPLDDEVDIVLADGAGREQYFAPGEASLRLAPEVHHDLEQLTPVLEG
jgi:hypothetical protein